MEIDLEPWRHYLAAFDQHIAAVKAHDQLKADLTRMLMRYELFRQPQRIPQSKRGPTYRTGKRAA